jgi:hypothetical protein
MVVYLSLRSLAQERVHGAHVGVGTGLSLAAPRASPNREPATMTEPDVLDGQGVSQAAGQ